MSQPEIFREPKDGPMRQPQRPALPAVHARVEMVVWEKARNEHVFYAIRADEKPQLLTQGPGTPIHLWPVRFSLRFWGTYNRTMAARFRRGTKLECIHLGAGYYEYDGPAPEANGPSPDGNAPKPQSTP